jgi:hypothetical protein
MSIPDPFLPYPIAPGRGWSAPLDALPARRMLCFSAFTVERIPASQWI